MFTQIERSAPLIVHMETYAKQRGASSVSLRFIFHGKKLSGRLTAADLCIEDGDVIDVGMELTGDIGDWEAADAAHTGESLMLDADAFGARMAGG